jgi:hypothetical protein
MLRSDQKYETPFARWVDCNRHPATWVRVGLLCALTAVAVFVKHPIVIENHKTVTIHEVAPTPLGPVYMPRDICLGLHRKDSLAELKKKYRYTEDPPFAPEFEIAENHKQMCMIDGDTGSLLVSFWVTYP